MEVQKICEKYSTCEGYSKMYVFRLIIAVALFASFGAIEIQITFVPEKRIGLNSFSDNLSYAKIDQRLNPQPFEPSVSKFSTTFKRYHFPFATNEPVEKEALTTMVPKVQQMIKPKDAGYPYSVSPAPSWSAIRNTSFREFKQSFKRIPKNFKDMTKKKLNFIFRLKPLLIQKRETSENFLAVPHLFGNENVNIVTNTTTEESEDITPNPVEEEFICGMTKLKFVTVSSTSVMFVFMVGVAVMHYIYRRRLRRLTDSERQRLIPFKVSTGIYYNQSGECF